MINDAIKPTGALTLVFENIETGKIEVLEYKNIVVTTGKQAIADVLRGNTANNRGQITYCALGTSTTAVDVADTALGAELYRKQISVRSVSGAVATFKTFFDTSEANGVLKEAGLFGDAADGTPGSGTLFCHTLINRTKTIAETLTLTWNVTVT